MSNAGLPIGMQLQGPHFREDLLLRPLGTLSPRRPGWRPTATVRGRAMPPQAPSYIRAIVPYPPGKPQDELEREYGISDSIKLASNENPLGTLSAGH